MFFRYSTIFIHTCGTFSIQKKIKALDKEHQELAKCVVESIDRCEPEVRDKLRPMLEVELIASVLQSIVAECKERGEDPTERLSSQELMNHIASVQKLKSGKDGIKAMKSLETVCQFIALSVQWSNALHMLRASHAFGSRVE